MRSFRYADSAQMYWARVSLLQSLGTPGEVSISAFYKMLEGYYLNNGVYDAVQQSAYQAAIWTEAMKGLRNPAHRVIEFYATKLWPGTLPGALPIVADNEPIVEAIQQVWDWSNFGAMKQVAARWLSLYGDWFVKVATRTNSSGKIERVYLQQIKPQYVTDFDVDERDFLTYIQIDIPRTRRNSDGKLEAYTHTEIWNKPDQSYRLYEHVHAAGTPTEQLGRATVEEPLSTFGIDFIPVVHAKFQDIGEPRGIGAFVHALDKVDEANRMATRLHQMLFRYNKVLWAISANATDPTGRPLPAPRVGSSTGTADSDTLELGDDTLLRLPGQSTLQSLVPQLQYQQALAILQDHMQELERDLPELAYYRLREMGGGLSGRAVRLLLSDAIDKALEARGNAETALVRANQMALTIGQNAGLFAGIGVYENGDFDHSFADRDIIALNDAEKAETAKAWTGSGVPLVTALRRTGWTEDDLAQMDEDKAAQSKTEQASLAQALLKAQRDFDQGKQPAATPATPTNGKVIAEEQDA